MRKVYDVNSFEDTYYIVMERCENTVALNMFCEDYYRRYTKDNQERNGTQEIIDMLKGLQCLHENGIILAGINPNSILTCNGVTKICEYSSAIQRGETIQSPTWEQDSDFLSPEQKESCERVDERSDIFSAGMIAFQWICGSLPQFYKGGTGVFRLNIRGGEKYTNVLAKAVAIDPDSRYQSATEFIEALLK